MGAGGDGAEPARRASGPASQEGPRASQPGGPAGQPARRVSGPASQPVGPGGPAGQPHDPSGCGPSRHPPLRPATVDKPRQQLITAPITETVAATPTNSAHEGIMPRNNTYRLVPGV